MTPLEELRAAHKRLSEMREAAFPGPWIRGDRAPADWGRTDLNIVACEGDAGDVTDYIDVTNVDLIVTLHRTIDAQLSIINRAIAGAKPYPVAASTYGAATYMPGIVGRDALELARAINGSDDA